MNAQADEIARLLAQMPRITLDEMKSIRLMKRTDCKFLTNLPTLLRLLALTQHDYYVQEVNGCRISPYTTLYFDTPGQPAMFRQHQTGRRPRRKVRVRSYVNAQLSFLEIKTKDNHGKTGKKRIAVPSADDVVANHTGEDFLREQTGLTFADLTPAVGNAFDRITLVNRDKTERLTIDLHLHFSNYQTGETADMEQTGIIELKRDGRCPSPILPMLRQLRIKPAGFSKYCIGACVTNPHLRLNKFKKRLVKIHKVTQHTLSAS